MSSLGTHSIEGYQDGNITRALNRNPGLRMVIGQAVADASEAFPGCQLALSFVAGLGVVLNIHTVLKDQDATASMQAFRERFTQLNRAAQGKLVYMFHLL